MNPLVVVALAAPAAISAYFVACRIWPFAACIRCGGTGRHKSSGFPFLAGGAALAVIAVWAEVPALILAAAALAGVGLLIRGGSWRSCRRCKGSGKRLRLGRRFMNSTASAADKA